MLTLCDTLDCLDIKLLCAWDSSGKNTGVGYHFPPPGDLPDSRDQTVSPVSCISHRLLSSLAGDSPWAHKELDIPEGLTIFHFHFQHYQETLDPIMQIKVRKRSIFITRPKISCISLAYAQTDNLNDSSQILNLNLNILEKDSYLITHFKSKF